MLYFIRWRDCINDTQVVLFEAKDDEDMYNQVDSWFKKNYTDDNRPCTYSPRKVESLPCYVNKER